MNVFLSAPSRDLDLVRALTTRLQDAGHEVFDWVTPYQNEGRMTNEQITANFHDDLAAVRNCDVFVLVVTSHMGPSTGCAMELGVALWFGKTARLLELVDIDDAAPWFGHPGRIWFQQHPLGGVYGRNEISKLMESLQKPF
jgi:nucleoside 2-deoxyribosyltransferase